MTETELKNLLKTVAPPDEAARAAVHKTDNIIILPPHISSIYAARPPIVFFTPKFRSIRRNSEKLCYNMLALI